jgi:nitroreductase
MLYTSIEDPERRENMPVEMIFSRRSIRKFTPEPVGEDALLKIMEAGMAAPSSRNLRPWHLVLVTRRETLDRLGEAHPHGKMLLEATAAIAVCGQLDISPDFWIQDCSAATENILLAATSLGLGSVWLGCHPREDRVASVREILGIPGGTGILSLVAIGHPAETKEPRTQYDPSRAHREKW